MLRKKTKRTTNNMSKWIKTCVNNRQPLNTSIANIVSVHWSPEWVQDLNRGRQTKHTQCGGQQWRRFFFMSGAMDINDDFSVNFHLGYFSFRWILLRGLHRWVTHTVAWWYLGVLIDDSWFETTTSLSSSPFTLALLLDSSNLRTLALNKNSLHAAVILLNDSTNILAFPRHTINLSLGSCQSHGTVALEICSANVRTTWWSIKNHQVT